jgi:fused signal recognition particle receptor
VQQEYIELGIAIIVIALIVFVMRRASAKSRGEAGTGARERLGLEEAPPKQRKRPIKQAKPVEAKKTEEAEEEEEPEAEEPAAPSDAETTAAYKQGLAKTRGGFVAKLGKLFGRKQIDAATVDELEEVLFTADIGPRAADRIFQSVKSGLSKSDL